VIELDDRQVIEADGSKFFDCYKWICLDGVIGLVSMATTTHIVSMVVMMEPNKLLILMTIDKWLKPAVQNVLIRTSVPVSLIWWRWSSRISYRIWWQLASDWRLKQAVQKMLIWTSVSVSMGLLVSKVKTIASNKWMNLMTIDKWLKPMVLISDKRVVALISNKRVEYLVNGEVNW